MGAEKLFELGDFEVDSGELRFKGLQFVLVLVVEARAEERRHVLGAAGPLKFDGLEGVAGLTEDGAAADRPQAAQFAVEGLVADFDVAARPDGGVVDVVDLH